MAERTVAVTLDAKVDPYVRAMGKARSATTDLEKSAGRDFTKLGSQMQSVGTKATLGVTAPLVGVGLAAINLSNDFDKSMSKIVGLVGIGADEVDSMKEAVLGLAGETARSPQELADGLFVITSAGLRGQEALDALESSAKASAAGLGETEDIARAVAGAMNAYGPETLGAAEATDILTAAARGGNFETSQLAGSLGKVLPFAKQAGASLEDVGGAVALLTRTNGNAAESITQINGLMRAFVTPTAEAATMLDELDMSAGDVRDSIGQNGLVATLEMLDGKLGGNREKLGRLIGSSEGASAAFQILDADAASLQGTFGVTANAAGMFGEAFDAAAGTDAFKMEQAMVDLKVAMIEIGTVLAPIAADVAGAIAGMAGAFSDLDPTVQKIIIALAGVAAAAGPVLIVAGSLVKSYATLKSVMAATNLTMAGGAATMGKLAAQAALMYAAFETSRGAMKGLQGDTEWLYKDSGGLQGVMQDIGRMSFEMSGGVKSAAVVWGEFEQEAANAFGAMTTGVYTMEQLDDRLAGSNLNLEAQNLIRIEFRKQLDATTEAEENLAEATAESSSQTSIYSGVLGLAESAAEGFSVATGTLEGAIADEEKAVALAEEAQANLEAQTQANAEAFAEFEEFAELARASHEKFIDSIMDSISGLFTHEQSVLNLENAYAAYQTQVEENIETQGDAEASDRDKEASANDLRLAEIDLAEEAYNTALAFAEEQGAVEGSAEWADIMKEKLREQKGQYPELRDEIKLYIGELDRIPRNIDIDIVAHYKAAGSSTVPVDINRGGARALGGPTFSNTVHEVVENGPELFQQGGRTFLLSSDPGFVVPLTQGATSATGSSVSANEIAQAMLMAFPSTMVLDVEGRQMTAHVRGVMSDREREMAGAR